MRFITFLLGCALVEGASTQFYPQASLAIAGPFALSADANTVIFLSGPESLDGPSQAIVLTRSGGVWSEQGIVDRFSGTQPYAVALSGDGNTAVFIGGGAWFYARVNGIWTQEAKLITAGISDAMVQISSVAVSFDGNTVAIGDPVDGSTGGVRVFSRTDGVWNPQGGKLNGSGDTSTFPLQGTAVALSGDGNTLLFSDKRGTSNYSGAAWIFTRSNGTWTQQGSVLLPSDVSGAAGMGVSAALSADGNTAIIGGPEDNQGGGAAWIFINVNGTWVQQGPKLVDNGPAGIPHGLGSSVALSADGNIAFTAGPPDNRLPSAVWVFTRANSVWSQFGSKITGAGVGTQVVASADGSTFATGGSYATFYATSPTPPAVTLSPSLAYVAANGGSGAFGVAFNPASTSWTAVSNASWLNVDSAASGTGNTTIGYSAGGNNSAASRTGTISVGGQLFTLIQRGMPGNYSFATTPSTMPAKGGTGTLKITATPPDAPWTVSSTVPWITISPPATGTGNGTVTYSVAANPSVDREGTAAVAGMSITVSQAGMSAVNSYSTGQGSPQDIVSGPDGALWFTEPQQDKIGRITTAGEVTEYPLSIPGAMPNQMAVGPDGALWFTASGSVGTISTSGQSRLFPLRSSSSMGITSGPDNALWFAERNDSIGRITTTGNITEYSLPPVPGNIIGSTGITAGPDGALWFVSLNHSGVNYIGRMTTSGTLTQFPLNISGSAADIITGSDGALWFAVNQTSGLFTPVCSIEVGRITTAGHVAIATTPNFQSPCSSGVRITSGPDGALWVASPGVGILQVSTAGVTTATYPANPAGGIAAGPDGVIWFTESGGIKQFPGPTPASGLAFYPVTPCRVMDTRDVNGPSPGRGIPANSVLDVPITSSRCGIPLGAQAYSLNVTAVPPGPLAYLTVFPAGQSLPLASTLNSVDGTIVANAAIVAAGANGDVGVYTSDATDVVIDINGYFAPQSNQGLAFYPATQCRVADTRGGQRMGGGQTRSFTISGTCNIPASAQAYSLNMTAAPPGTLTYVSVWPAGQSQPATSTLNSDGRIAANAAIVAAGANGAINVFAANPTDVVIDVNGYFAAPGGPNASYFYPAVPCRAADTRSGEGLTANNTRTFLMNSPCGIPSAAWAYSLNETVVPPGPLAYLTTWPQGETQPFVSTLNSPLGKVVANAAIVQAGASGGIAVFVTDPTDLILDINGYFAPSPTRYVGSAGEIQPE